MSVGREREAFLNGHTDQVLVGLNAESSAQLLAHPIDAPQRHVHLAGDVADMQASREQSQHGAGFRVELPVAQRGLHRGQVLGVRGRREVWPSPQCHVDGHRQTGIQIVADHQVAFRPSRKQVADQQPVARCSHDDDVRRRHSVSKLLDQRQRVDKRVKAVAQQDDIGLYRLRLRDQIAAVFGPAECCLSSPQENGFRTDDTQAVAVCDQDSR